VESIYVHSRWGKSLTLTQMRTITYSMCYSRMMAADGRCKTLTRYCTGWLCVTWRKDAVSVLKHASDALRDEDNILAIIRGSAIVGKVKQWTHTFQMDLPSQTGHPSEALEAVGQRKLCWGQHWYFPGSQIS